MLSNCQYRVSAKALIKDGEGRLLFVEEKAGNGFELPGGGIENGENIRQTLERELQEEIQVRPRDIADSPTFVWLINGEVVWLIFEVQLMGQHLQPTDHIASAGYYSMEELLSAGSLGYCCKLYQDDLKCCLK